MLMRAYLPGMSLGAQIRRYREELRLTLEELSALCDVNVGTISALEVRGSERSKYAPILAAAFGLTVEQLLDTRTTYPARPTPHWEKNVSTNASDNADRQLREPATKAYIWPMKRVTPAEWDKLTAEERAQVEGYIQGMLSTRQPNPQRQASPWSITAPRPSAPRTS